MKQRVLLFVSVFVLALLPTIGVSAHSDGTELNAIYLLKDYTYDEESHTLTIKTLADNHNYITVEDVLCYQKSGDENYYYGHIDTVIVNAVPKLTKIDFYGKYLKKVVCRDNNSLTTVDVQATLHKTSIEYFDFSGCRYLEKIRDIGTHVKSLDITGCTSLKVLSCTNSDITKLDVSSCDLLETLQCDGCTSLTQIILPNNTDKLKNVDVNDCTSLQNLDLSQYNNLTNVSFTGCDNLQNIKLPQSENTTMRTLVFDKTSLDSLDVSNYLALDTLICTNSERLSYIKLSPHICYLNCERLMNLNYMNIDTCQNRLTYFNSYMTNYINSHKSLLSKCKNLTWYIGSDEMLTNNVSVTSGYIVHEKMGTLCWPEDLILNSKYATAVYTINGLYSINSTQFIGLTKIKTRFDGQSDDYALEKGRPYVIVYANDTIKMTRNIMPANPEMSVVSAPVNNVPGAYGTFQPIEKDDIKYKMVFVNGILSTVTNDDIFTLAPHYVYFDFNAEGINTDADDVVAAFEDDSIIKVYPGKQSVTDDIDVLIPIKNSKSDVYNLNGIKIKANSSKEDVINALPKGTYIIDGKIVIK